MIKTIRSVGHLAFWTAFSWSCFLVLSLLSVLLPFNLFQRVAFLQDSTWIQTRAEQYRTIVTMPSYSDLILHVVHDATSTFLMFAYELIFLLIVALFGPDIGDLLGLRVPYKLRVLNEFMTFGGEGNEDGDDDCSEPPPLEDCSEYENEVIPCSEDFVMDPVFGMLDREVFFLWREQQRERDGLRSKPRRRRSIPPVRYSQEAS